MKRTFRRTSYLLERILPNMGVSAATPLLERFSKLVANGNDEKRWLNGFLLDVPEEFDGSLRLLPLVKDIPMSESPAGQALRCKAAKFAA